MKPSATLSLSVFTSLIFSLHPVSAEQLEKVNAIPTQYDYMQISDQDGLVHAYEKGAFSNFIREYIPEGETVKKWTRMLSIAGLGPASSTPNAKKAPKQLIEMMEKFSCAEFKIIPVRKTNSENVFHTYCKTNTSVKIPNIDLREVELATYRFIKTDETLYQIHYSQHGSKKKMGELFGSNGEEFWSKGLEMVNNIDICNFKETSPCIGLDIDAINGNPVLDDNGNIATPAETPPCRLSNDIPCNPSAAVIIQNDNPDEKVKNSLIIINAEAEDISSVALMNRTVGQIAFALKKKAPIITVVMRLDKKNSEVSSKTRAQAATFFNLVNTVLVGNNLVKKDLTSLHFYNFR